VAAGLRAGVEQAKDSAENAREMITEYVQQNQGPVMRQEEIDEFSAGVEETRESVERLEARIHEMEESQE